MTKRHPDEVILERWTVPPAHVRGFVAEMRTRYANSPFPPKDLLKACEKGSDTGLEVVCRDDAVFVGKWCLSFVYNNISLIGVRERWIEFEVEGQHELLVPIAPDDRAAAQRIVEHWHRAAEQENREYLAKRNAPTLSNHLLNFAEAHFAWVALGFFFIVIPAIVLVIGWFRGEFD